MRNNPLSLTDPSGFRSVLCSDSTIPCVPTSPAGWAALGTSNLEIVDVWGKRLRNAVESLKALTLQQWSIGGMDLKLPGEVADSELEEVVVKAEKPEGPKEWVCRSASAFSGAAGGAVAGAVFALSTGQVEAIAPLAIGGAVVGSAVGFVTPSGGVRGAIAGGFASVVFHTPSGTTLRGATEVFGDAANGGVPLGAATIPVGAVVGAVTVGGDLLGLGQLASRFLGATAGGKAAAAGLAVTTTLDGLLSTWTECRL